MDGIQQLLGKILDDVRGSWRFRWYALGVAWVICLLGWAFVITRPNVYQASARVYLDSQSALRPLLQGLAVNPDVESDLTMVRQALLSRPQLEKVARQTGLDLSAKTEEDKERLIAGLQKSIIIQNDARVSNSSTDGLYRLSFQYGNRVQTLGVVQQLLDTFVEDTLGTKRTGQEDAQRFLQGQLADYEQRLTDAENRLSEFKKQNVGRMPDSQGDYFQRLQIEQTGLDTARSALTLALARRDETARQLSGEEPLIFGIDDNNSAEAGSKGGDIAVRIRDLEGRLEELLLRYTDKHPEVIAVRNTLAELRTQQAQELARIRQGQRTDGSLSSSLKSNPVYQSLQVEKNRAEVQVAELQQDVARRSAKVAELRRMIDVVPDVEAELGRLNRDYEVTRTQYQQLLQRLETAKLSEQADKTGTVSFRVIEPPSVSLEPIAPKRGVMLVGVLIISIVLGFGTAYIFNMLKPVFQNARAAETVLGLPVMGCIGHVATTLEQSHKRRDLLLYAASAGLLVAIYVGVSMLSAAEGGRFLEQLLS